HGPGAPRLGVKTPALRALVPDSLATLDFRDDLRSSPCAPAGDANGQGFAPCSAVPVCVAGSSGSILLMLGLPPVLAGVDPTDAHENASCVMLAYQASACSASMRRCMRCSASGPRGETPPELGVSWKPVPVSVARKMLITEMPYSSPAWLKQVLK